MAARLASICLMPLLTACDAFGAGANPRVSDAEYIDAFVECSPGAIRTGDVIVAIRACP